MAFEKIGQGFLSRNQYKDNDKKPEYKGKLTIKLDGREMEVELGAWVKENERGKYFSIAASAELGPKEQQKTLGEGGSSDDEVPF